MPYLQMFLKYWIMIAFIVVFYCGYRLRGLQDSLKLYKESAKLAISANNLSSNFEKTRESIDIQTQNLNQKLKVIYADTGYRCLIPADGVLIINQANH